MKTSRVIEMLSVNLRLCILEISSGAGRTAITTLGLFLGIASLLINLSFVRGMDDDLRAAMERIGGLNIVTVRKVDPTTPQEAKLFQRSPGLSFDEAETAVEGLDYVESILRSNEIGWVRINGEGTRSRGNLLACSPGYLSTYNYSVSRGRLLNEEDMRGRRSVCLIGTRLAQRLFSDSDPIGRRLTIRTYSLTVVGLLATSGNMRSRRDIQCCIPFPLYASRFENAEKNLESISITLSGTEYVDRARTELTRRFRALHRGVTDFEIEMSADKIREMRTASLAMKIVLWSIACISLLVGGISIMNIMFATIGDRIREIGIRKALGARKYDIFTQFLLEAILVCFFGGIPGMALGTAIIFAPEGLFPYIPRLTPIDFSIAFGFTLVAGILSGLFPAMKAANMQPVDALQY